MSQRVVSVIYCLATATTTYSSTMMKMSKAIYHIVLYVVSQNFLRFSNLLDILMKKFIIRKKTKERQPSSKVCKKIRVTSVANAYWKKISINANQVSLEKVTNIETYTVA